MPRQMTEAGRAFIEKEEGLRLEAYDDATGRPVPVNGHVQGVLTIGIGHTGPDVVKGMRITREQAYRLFDHDNDWAERAVEENMVGPNGERPNNNQFDACCSLTFNIGAAGFAGSSVVRNWKKGLWKQAGDAFALWNRDKFGVNDVLVGRRARETALFFTPVTPTLDVAMRLAPAPMPQEVAAPKGAASSPTVIATAAQTAGSISIAVENAKPALESITYAANTAQQAKSTMESIGSLLSNGHVLTFLIMAVAAGIGIYVLVRVIRRIRSGQAKA